LAWAAALVQLPWLPLATVLVLVPVPVLAVLAVLAVLVLVLVLVLATLSPLAALRLPRLTCSPRWHRLRWRVSVRKALRTLLPLRWRRRLQRRAGQWWRLWLLVERPQRRVGQW
jgi:hypothetical protein